jgi:hypothetical protein
MEPLTHIAAADPTGRPDAPVLAAADGAGVATPLLHAPSAIDATAIKPPMRRMGMLNGPPSKRPTGPSELLSYGRSVARRREPRVCAALTIG